jgi:hypothetical protein
MVFISVSISIWQIRIGANVASPIQQVTVWQAGILEAQATIWDVARASANAAHSSFYAADRILLFS